MRVGCFVCTSEWLYCCWGSVGLHIESARQAQVEGEVKRVTEARPSTF